MGDKITKERDMIRHSPCDPPETACEHHTWRATDEEVLAVLRAATEPLSTISVAEAVHKAWGCARSGPVRDPKRVAHALRRLTSDRSHVQILGSSYWFQDVDFGKRTTPSDQIRYRNSKYWGTVANAERWKKEHKEHQAQMERYAELGKTVGDQLDAVFKKAGVRAVVILAQENPMVVVRLDVAAASLLAAQLDMRVTQ